MNILSVFHSAPPILKNGGRLQKNDGTVGLGFTPIFLAANVDPLS